VPTAPPGQTAGALLASLAGRTFDTADLIFIVANGGRLRGVVPLTAALAAEPGATLEALQVRDWPTVTPVMDREDAASLAIHNAVSALAVSDRDGRFLGAVPASALLSILRDEHLEDLHHMAGILGRSEAARRALYEPPRRRAVYRLPWLLVGLLGSALATAVMAGYQGALEANIAIAFFVPAIVYLADAIGTQSEAVAVRGLSLAPPKLGTLVAGELGTGALIGVVLAGLAFVMVWTTFKDVALAASVALALFAAGTVASSVGSLLPWLFSRAGYDPAHGSGPVGTVIQDVLSLIIYFTIANALVT
jgi:magnesium transporter